MDILSIGPLKLVGLIALGGILAWLRWNSPEQVKARLSAQITKLESQIEKKKKRRDELLAKKPHDFDDAVELAGVINDIGKLQQKVNNLKGQ